MGCGSSVESVVQPIVTSSVVPNQSVSVINSEDIIEVVRTDPTDEFAAFKARARSHQKQLQLLLKASKRRNEPPLPENTRVIRPFLSSTFRDFNQERDLFFKTACPRLEAFCASKGLYFAPLDLRWGITSEQSGSGHVIKICLDEVDRSRPYFVLSLGFRNGWAHAKNAEKPDELLQKTFELGKEFYPWVEHFDDRSVTEIEILHGILNDIDRMPRIFVYFRDVAFLDQVPSDQLRTYVDTGDAESKLNNLKERIICSGVPVKWFSSPAEMVSLLEADLAASISADFGDRFSNQTALQKELSAQQAIIDTCCDIYEGGAGYIEAFRAYLNADVTNQSILVVSGARGSGKSAALANFAQSLKTSAQKKLLPVAMSASGKVDWNNVVVLSRFVGASLQSGRLSSLIASLLDELKFHFGDAVIADEDSDRQPTGDELREKLEIASRKAPLVVILDGLDLLRADDRSKLMSFLPLSFGSRCRVYVSCPPSMLSQFSSLAIKRVDVRLLDDVECTRLVDAYLSRFGKMLDQQQKRQVLACSQSRSPLFLRTFLEEIRTFGSYEKLGDRLTHYLSSADLGVLIDKVFGRIETDMASLGNDTQTLVHAMLGALACARRGLTENELRTICLRALHQLDDCKPVLASLPFPALVFSSLQIQCSPFLVSHLGIMSFAHSTVADAARSRYLNDEKSQITHHRRSALHFLSESSMSVRKLDELPAHLSALIKVLPSGSQSPDPTVLKSQQDACLLLKEFVLNPLTFSLLGGHSVSSSDDSYGVDALEYIRLLLQVSPQFDIVAEFSQALSKHSNNVSASAVSESNPFHDALLQASQDLGSLYERVASWLTHIAGCSAGLAVPLLLRASEIRIADQSSSVRHVAHTNHMIAQLYSAQNEHSNALPFAETAITLFLPVLPSSIQASVTLPTKLVKSGSTHFNIAEGGEKESIKFFCTLLLSYAQCLAALSSLSVSISMFEQVLSLQMSHKFDDLTLAATRNNMADVLMSSESYDQALQHYEFSARVYQAERGSDSIELANILSSQASALLQLGADLNSVRQMLERARGIKESRFGPRHSGTVKTLSNLAAVCVKLGDEQEAVTLLQLALQIREETYGSTHVLVMQTLRNLAQLYVSLKSPQPAAALPLLQRALKIAHSSKNTSNTELDTVEFELLSMIASTQISLGQNDAAIASLNSCISGLDSAIANLPAGSASKRSAQVVLLDALLALSTALGDTDQEGAKRNAQRALDVADELNRPNKQAESIMVLAPLMLATQTGSNDAVIALFQRALAIRQQQRADLEKLAEKSDTRTSPLDARSQQRHFTMQQQNQAADRVLMEQIDEIQGWLDDLK